MVASSTRHCFLLTLLLLALVGTINGQLSWANVDTSKIPRICVQRGLNYLNDITPNGHTYKQGSLVAAQIMVTQDQSKIYRLKFNLEPVCKANGETCPRESCTLDARMDNDETPRSLNFDKNSVNCRDSPLKNKQQQTLIINDAEQNQQFTSDNTDVKTLLNQSNVSLDREVQMSADYNDRPFVAVKATKVYCPNCPFELNSSLPGLVDFENQALKSMDETSVGDFKHKLVNIVRVTRTVPLTSNVIRFHLLMEIGESTCLRTSHIDASECSLQSNLPVKLCLVTYEERPWHTGSRHVTANNCTDSLLLDNDNEVSASVEPSAVVSSSSSREPYPSQQQDDQEDPTKTEVYDQIAQEAQEVFRVPGMELSTAKGAVIVEELPHTKLVIDRPNEQQRNDETVKLDQDKIKEFDKFLFENFELTIKTSSTVEPGADPVNEEIIVKEHIEDDDDDGTSEQIVSSRQAELLPTVESKRSKRSLNKALEGNKAGLRKLAIKAVEMIDELDEDNKKKQLIKVIDSAREQQSHGIIYHLTIEVVPTDCRESEASTECLDEVILSPSQICKCDLITSEKRPLVSPKLLHYSCNNKEKSEIRLKRQLGSRRPIDKNDPEVQKYAKLGLNKYSEGYRGTREPIIHRIKEVTHQIVAGEKYRIVVDIGPSSCERGVIVNCQKKNDEVVEECVIEAWIQAWLNFTKIDVDCDKNAANSRKKRSLKGANYSAKMLDQAKKVKSKKLFEEFVSKYKKKYANDEEKRKRYEIFLKNLDMIEELQRNEQGTGRYGVTVFADLNKDEFKANYLGLKPSLKSENDIPLPIAEIPDIKLPDEYDWRNYNAVTPVKNQGQCGSCWAFSVTGNIEGQYAIKHGKLLSLSEQELVDCDKFDDGCNGGMPDAAYRAIEELGGLETEADYPYEAENEKCHFSKSMAKVRVVSGLNITSNETRMAQWLVKNGPMSIGINANAMQFYMGGVSHPYHFLCSPDSLDHGVLIVGYGVKSYPIFKKTLPYWIIKNSWGPHWGERGYYRVYRGDGSCGVNKMVTSAVVD